MEQVTADPPAAWHRAADELPPPGVAVVVRTRDQRYYEACWSSLGFWRSRDWLGFCVPEFVEWWAEMPEEGR